jgi:hypothetical protein
MNGSWCFGQFNRLIPSSISDLLHPATLMKSGKAHIAARDGVVAFEMEGVWESFPASLVIKGVCQEQEMTRSCGSNCRSCYKWFSGELEYRYAISSFDSYLMCSGENELKIYTGAHKGISHPSAPLPLGVRNGELEKDPARRAKELLHIEIEKNEIRRTCDWFVAHELFRDWQERIPDAKSQSL